MAAPGNHLPVAGTMNVVFAVGGVVILGVIRGLARWASRQVPLLVAGVSLPPGLCWPRWPSARPPESGSSWLAWPPRSWPTWSLSRAARVLAGEASSAFGRWAANSVATFRVMTPNQAGQRPHSLKNRIRVANSDITGSLGRSAGFRRVW